MVASSTIYGGTFNLLAHTLLKMGIETTFVSPDCTPDELDAAFRPNTRCVFGETIANPALTVFDIERFAAAAHAHGVPLIVDNTFPTPVNCRPIEWGADIVTHSTTKYMDGHGVAVGGAIVDSGNFDWMAHAEKFPGLTTPDESYHGIVYAERFGQGGAFITKATSQLMISPLRDMKICYDSFYKKMCNLANIPLEAISIFHERNNENENIEDVFKEFLQYLSINKKRGHGILFSLAGNNNPVHLGDRMSAVLGEKHVTPPVRIAKHGPDRYAQLEILNGEKIFFYCKNCENKAVELPLSMDFCISFSSFLNAYDPSIFKVNGTVHSDFSTLISRAGGIFLLFLASHAALRKTNP